jgi:hypothetical protein
MTKDPRKHQGDTDGRRRLRHVLSVIGFAIGGLFFWKSLINYNTEKITRQVAVVQIAASYREWVDLFEKKDHAAG